MPETRFSASLIRDLARCASLHRSYPNLAVATSDRSRRPSSSHRETTVGTNPGRRRSWVSCRLARRRLTERAKCVGTAAPVRAHEKLGPVGRHRSKCSFSSFVERNLLGIVPGDDSVGDDRYAEYVADRSTADWNTRFCSRPGRTAPRSGSTSPVVNARGLAVAEDHLPSSRCSHKIGAPVRGLTRTYNVRLPSCEKTGLHTLFVPSVSCRDSRRLRCRSRTSCVICAV